MNLQDIPEIYSVIFYAPTPRDIRATAALLRPLGARRSTDLIAFPRNDKVEPWQSDAYSDVVFMLAGEEQYLDDDQWDELSLEYPFAVVPATWASSFLELVQEVARVLGLEVHVGGVAVDEAFLASQFQALVEGLRSHGLEPGSLDARREFEYRHE